ncbi:hypothetical protein PORCRE_1233 [Porphyromonas crevioricanis JCM 15906]|uniref:Uncharacterized protein n=1 Tax=Porphyromonas crevioricanis JCM 15906 TaxID=1305617 RepID=T1CR29_9PORP|nr:hypothetical protein PORCRE_1233 [Porphyromonas crevioricanis JCM 15906]GAD07755.1 hypothetical protein PORCAN_1382 [Porphyromonas crevioricanis JCM 13913]
MIDRSASFFNKSIQVPLYAKKPILVSEKVEHHSSLKMTQTELPERE